jgi:hypothetical protein
MKGLLAHVEGLAIEGQTALVPPVSLTNSHRFSPLLTFSHVFSLVLVAASCQAVARAIPQVSSNLSATFRDIPRPKITSKKLTYAVAGNYRIHAYSYLFTPIHTYSHHE